LFGVKRLFPLADRRGFFDEVIRPAKGETDAGDAHDGRCGRDLFGSEKPGSAADRIMESRLESYGARLYRQNRKQFRIEGRSARKTETRAQT
jgi:hypothetical protein